jgi:hypothetical protein
LLYVNHHDIAQALERYADHPVLGPASFTLAAVANAADHNSDGRAHWPKPARAARQLIELIGTTRDYLNDRERPRRDTRKAAARLPPTEGLPDPHRDPNPHLHRRGIRPSA